MTVVQKRVLFFLIGIYLFFILIGFLLPSSNTVSRSVVIDAPKERVYQYISSPESFRRWCIWLNIDKNVDLSYEGPKEGPGAILRWTSEHPRVGSGSAEYKVLEPDSSVEMTIILNDNGGKSRLDSSRRDNTTVITWQFEQEAVNIFARYFGALLLDKVLAPDLETSLLALKRIVEMSPATLAERKNAG